MKKGKEIGQNGVTYYNFISHYRFRVVGFFIFDMVHVVIKMNVGIMC